MENKTVHEPSPEEAKDALESHWKSIYSGLAEKLKDNIEEDEVGVDLAEDILKSMKRIQGALKQLDEAFSAAEIAEGELLGIDSIGHKNPAGLREIEINVSQGMLNISALSLTPAVKAGTVKLGEQMIITLPDDNTFTTTVSSPGNRLAERGMIGRFFEQEKIEPYSVVYLEETKRGHWLLYGPNSSRHEQKIHFLLQELDDAVVDVRIDKSTGTQQTKLRGREVVIRIDWHKAGKDMNDTVIHESSFADAFVELISKLRETYGSAVLYRLSMIETGRGPLVTKTPQSSYLYSKDQAPYAHKEIKGAPGYYALTHSESREKMKWIERLRKELGIPEGAITVTTAKE
ncbi:MAG: hypothetical protein IT582_02915 [Opitutaceae bacterium]|nr:hypothetical protein [Opitutaceae bacterium]